MLLEQGCSQRAATRGYRLGSFRAISMVNSSASARLSCGSSLAAATAAITFRRWIAFWKIPYDRPCEVEAAPLRGRDGGLESMPQAGAARAAAQRGHSPPRGRRSLEQPQLSLRTIFREVAQALQPPERDRLDLTGLRVADPEPVAAYSVVPATRKDDGLGARDFNASLGRTHSVAGGAGRDGECGDQGSDG